ncbi:MAG: TetR/AcrR family transcriptional regulator [Pirellulales bacterium]|nr:TetR/AcrR family transcriptional regulator [Pirellulales bacterium]
MSDEKLGTEIRKEQIAEAALKLVSSHGLGRLSVAAVARRVGLVPSGIYRHFRSKDEILSAMLDLIERRLTDNVHAASEESADPLTQLRGVLVRHIRFIREGRAIPRIVFADETFVGHPERKTRVQQILRGYLGRVSRIIQQGQEQGQVRPELDPETVAMMIIGIVMPAGVLWHLSDGGFDVTRHADRAWQMLHRAIAADGT